MMYDGWIYVAKSDTGHYKIGRSKTPVERVKHFDTIMPVEVRVIAMIPCDDYVTAEKKLHEFWGEFRHCGEWFSIPPHFEWLLINPICYLDGEFIRRQGESIWGGFINSCCTSYLENHTQSLIQPPF